MRRNGMILALALSLCLGLRAAADEPLAQELSPTAQALSPTAALPELPGGLSSTAAPELPASLPAATVAPTPEPVEEMEFIAQAPAKRFPRTDTLLAGFGGCLVGSTVAFFSSEAQNSDNVADFQKQFQRTWPLYGGGGFLLGGVMGYFFGGEPAMPAPPELKQKSGLGFRGLDLAAAPQGGRLDLRLDF